MNWRIDLRPQTDARLARCVRLIEPTKRSDNSAAPGSCGARVSGPGLSEVALMLLPAHCWVEITESTWVKAVWQGYSIAPQHCMVHGIYEDTAVNWAPHRLITFAETSDRVSHAL
jgi:hypothetical protein